jgi:putative ABC transport system permease protein
MSGWARLVLAYVRFHWGKTLVLVICLWLAAFLPIAVAILLRQFSRQIVARADATPAVVGHAGSGLDLALHATHFRRAVDRVVPVSEADTIRDSGLAEPVPLFCRFTARGRPLVGTTPDYFGFRRLRPARGRIFLRIGECVLGSRVASDLGLGPGDMLLSDRENVIDIAGLYPLKMKVAGVLERSGTPDDSAVFTDLKTAWIIQGLGHGHQDLQSESDPGLVIGRDDANIVASAAVLPYTEITPENIGSFHFHGDPATFPLTAIIANSPDEKSATILAGRYPAQDGTIQLVMPRQATDELLGLVFQTEQFFLANAVLIAISTGLLIGLVALLSRRLRQDELDTMFRIGCSRGTVGRLLLGEFLVVLVLAAILLIASLVLVRHFAGEVVQRLVVG